MDHMNVADAYSIYFIKDQCLITEHLYEKERIRKKFVSYPDWLCDNLIDELKSKEEHDLDKDMEIVGEMLKVLVKYESNQSNLRQTLILIGNLSGEISYNDLGDRDNHYIRNRYGYIKRNWNNSINRNGIYFERLYQLKIILSNDHIYLSIPEVEIDKLRTPLSCLKQKLLYILKEHKSSIDQQNSTIDFSVSISDLTDFSRKYYEIIIVRRINDELGRLEGIDFSLKDDRYYFARAFCIIGDLLNEWLRDQCLENRNDVTTTLKYLIKFRNQLIHRYVSVKRGMDEDNQSINEMIIEVKHHLKHVIVNDNRCHSTIDFSYVDIDKFRDVTNRLLAAFSGKVMKVEPVKRQVSRSQRKRSETTMKDEDVKNKLTRLLSRSCGIIEGTKSNINVKVHQSKSRNSIEEQLMFLNDQYQRYLSKLDQHERSNYPHGVHMVNGDIIKMFCDKKDPKPTQLLDPHRELMNKFDSKMQYINEEAEYLFDFLNRCSNSQSKMSSMKRKYIVQFVVVVIFQLLKDIDSLNICQQSKRPISPGFQQEYLTKLSYIDKFSSSVLMRDSKNALRQLRNRILESYIWFFDEIEFDEIFKEIKFSIFLFQAFYGVLNMTRRSTSCSTLFAVGKNFFEIGLFDEAVDCFEEALARLEHCPTGSGEISATEFCDEKINSEFKRTFQMGYGKYVIYDYLFRGYICCGRFDKAREIIDFLHNRISAGKIEKISDSMFERVGEIFVFKLFLAIYLRLETIEITREILDAVESRCRKISTKMLLAKCYLFRKNFSKAKELSYKIVENNSGRNERLHAMEIYAVACFELTKDEHQINESLDEMESISDGNLYDLKSTYRNKYLTLKSSIIDLKLKMMMKTILNNNNEVANNTGKFRELSKQFKELISKYQNPFRDDPCLIDLCFGFFSVFIYIHKINITIDLKGAMLKESQYYFDLIVGINDTLPETVTSTIKGKLSHIVDDLSEAYIDFVMSDQRLSSTIKMKYLIKILTLQMKCNVTNVVVLINLRYGLSVLLDEYSKNHKYKYQQKLGDLKSGRCAHFTECFLSMMKYIQEEEPRYFNHTNMRKINFAKIHLTYFNKSLTSFRHELRFFAECIACCDEVLQLPLVGKLRDYVRCYKEIIESIATKMTDALNQILKSFTLDHQLSLDDRFTIEYLWHKFHIEISREKKWMYRGDLSMDQLKHWIRLELNYSSREMSLFYRFYKILRNANIIRSTHNLDYPNEIAILWKSLLNNEEFKLHIDLSINNEKLR